MTGSVKAMHWVHWRKLASALIFFAIVLACPPWAFGQGAAKEESNDASAVVLGSCNVVQQNVTATDQATIINEIDCMPEKPEDSFLLRYLWLDATTSSFVVAGRFDPALARLLSASPVIVRNPVFQKVQEIVIQFGLPANSATESLRSDVHYKIMGKGGEGDIAGSGLQQAPLAALKKLRIYAGEEKIIWPDVPSLRAVFKTQDWPSDYKLTYAKPALSDDLKKPQASQDFQNAVISCVLLHAPVPASSLMNYWDSMAELETTLAKREFRHQDVLNAILGADESNYNSSLVQNKSIDAMLYFGDKNWPDDFLLSFGNAVQGGCGDEETYNFGFYALPRRLFTLVAVIEPRHKDLQIEKISYLADTAEQLRLLRQGAEPQSSPSGVITVKKGEMAVIPLRIELRYDLEDADLPIVSLFDSNTANALHKRIANAALPLIKFTGRDSVGAAENADGLAKNPVRTIFSKSVASFRPPETRKINRTYVFGPAYELKAITIKGNSVIVRSAPAAAVAFLGQTGIGSCPFLYVSDGVGDPSRVKRVLVGASRKELGRIEEIPLPPEARSFFISEQEPEVTFIETVALRDAQSGEERVVASNLAIRPGRSREFQIPEAFQGRAILKLRGYYTPLRFDEIAAREDGAKALPAQMESSD